MTSKHFSYLEEFLNKWLEKCCDEDGQVTDWYIGKNLTRLMADAARSVFDASEDGQEYAESQAPGRKSA